MRWLIYGIVAAILFGRNRSSEDIDLIIEKINLENYLMHQHSIRFSKIEIQIPFKLFLGSEKDIEDTKYLYKIFKDKLDLSLLENFNRKLKIEELFNKYII